jgi:UDP-glucose 4-epimerase
MIPSMHTDGTRHRGVQFSYTRRVERILVTTDGRSPELLERLPFEFEVLDTASSGDALMFARRIIDHMPTTLIHLGVESESLLAALARLSGLKRLIVRSDLAVHGTGPRMPSVVSSDRVPTSTSNRFERSFRSLERDVRAFSRERPDIAVTILRPAPLLGDSGPMSRYLSQPIIPTILGFDPRLQFLHAYDAARMFEHAVVHPVPGTFDVTAPGQTYLSRVARLGRRRLRPVPEPLFRRLAPELGLPAHLVNLLKFGRVVQPMPASLGFRPMHTCRSTIIEFYEV